VESRDVQRRRTDYAGSYTGNVAEVAGHCKL
jgi:hypothetical protein